MFGAVIFDDASRPGSGWACVAGQEAFRIRGTGDLATDICWWSNLEGKTVFSIPGLQVPHIKREDYLKPDMGQLHAELGLLVTRMPAARITEISAEIFGRILRLAGQHYGLERPSGFTLVDDLYQRIIKADEPIEPMIDEALKQSWQPFVKTQSAAPAGTKMFVFRRPRIVHALDVLSTPVPGEQWEYVPGDKMPPMEKRVDWIVNQSRPAIVRASVKRVDHEVAGIISYASGATEQRGWMSHPELLTLSKFARIQIDGAFMGSEYVAHPIYKDIFTGGPMGPLSVSVGILAENYWHALSSVRTFKRFKTQAEKVYPPRAVWYAASDRFHMLMPALMMHTSGFSVRGYGRGQVILAVQRGALEEARACAAAAGLLSPLHVNEEIAVQSALAS